MASGDERAKKQARVSSPAYDFLSKHAAEAERAGLQTFLESNRIVSLEDLNDMKFAEPLVFLDLYTNVVPSLYKEVNDINKLVADEIAQSKREAAIEDVLHQKGDLGLELAGLPDHNINKQVQQIDNLYTGRGGPLPVILVLGSSGSGKTTFAAKVLKPKIREDFSADRICTVYFTADVVRDRVSSSSEQEPAERVAANAIICKVRRMIENEVGSFLRERPFDMFMVVIVDEVGVSQDTAWVGTKEKLDVLTSSLQAIANKAQLVLVGTGLDRITSSVNSNQDCVKIRMRPWSFEHVKWFANNYLDENQEGKGMVIRTVAATPILRMLTTNARATKFMMQSLQKYVGYFDSNALIDHAVTDVAFHYIKSNGLKGLNKDERRRVAKLVFMTLSGSKYKQANQVFPKELNTAPDNIQSSVFSLMESHVEKCGLAGGDFAVSVSPAVTIVLTALMGCISTLSSTWSGFERIAALSELQHYFVNSEENRVPTLIRTTLCFPPTRSTCTIKVPRLTHPTVIVNGRGASYADVIGHKRLIQCKHKAVDDKKAGLNLKAELAKLGVLKAERYSEYTDEKKFRLNRFLTNRLLEQWKCMDGSQKMPQAATSSQDGVGALGDLEMQRMPQGATVSEGGKGVDSFTRLMYPMEQLDIRRETDEIEVDEYSYDESSFRLGGNQVDVNLSSLPAEITVVFCTNKVGFQLLDPTMSVNLLRRHLDDNGKIMIHKDLPANQHIVDYLDTLVDKDKVSILFQVCTESH